jgi:pyrimidine deaminase RibD-like protein
MVGSVLVRDDRVLAEGIHTAFGQHHAERNLLLSYSDPISATDTLYVNLAPCVSSPTKKTPGCVDIIVERGVRKVVFGMVDVDPRIADKGVSYLKSKGIVVEGPYLAEECLDFNRGFVNLRTRGRPWFTLLTSGSLPEILPKGAAWGVAGDNHYYAALLIDEPMLESTLFMDHLLALRSSAQRPTLIILSLSGNDLIQKYQHLQPFFRIVQLKDSALLSWDNPSEELKLNSTLLTSVPFILGTPTRIFPGVSSLLVLGSHSLGRQFKDNEWLDS